MNRLTYWRYAAGCVGALIVVTASHAAAPAKKSADGDTQPPMDTVVVESLRHPEDRSYARVVQGTRIFEQYRQLAPKASLRFKVYPRKAGVDMHDLRLRIVSRSVRIPLELDDDLSFEVPVDETALRENADLIYNRADGSLGWRTDVRTPGIPPSMRRLGDLRLECLVEAKGAHVARGFNPLALATVLGANPCESPQFHYHFYADRSIFDVTLEDGPHRASLPIGQLYGNDMDALQRSFMDWQLFRDRVFLAPLHEKGWSDETLLEFAYMEDPSQPGTTSGAAPGCDR
jgi:hypothetical protein